MKILGIETSCDETAVAIVTGDGEILSHEIFSQVKQHMPYGGVVPEIASRAHMDALDILTKKAMLSAGINNYNELSGIAVTAGPGLIGGVIVGVMMAKGIAAVSGIPIIPINHLEGHALTIRLVNKNTSFPFLLLLVSGGHCQILKVLGIGKYERLGGTIDDALGEAFDKIAKMLGLDYPGGPIVEKYALNGDAKRFSFPRSMIGKEGCDFSFSGLKTAVKRVIDHEVSLISVPISNSATTFIKDMKMVLYSDICASFQACVGDIIEDRISNAIKMCTNMTVNTLVIAGGVAANKYLFTRLKELCDRKGIEVKAPPINLCTDNAAMIAWAGIERMKLGYNNNDLSFAPKARWPLTEVCS